ncbi:hypothetical protein TICRE_07770 [Tissierella creatinophila DSM 6911]|uniref:Uncharacterized protein n=1 Tax=Tissierella creatinophila DSM 6911 TaxID=1123403 RepID=A0A1U7M717_TISCR|nr:hypothetical protein TICRE_07770 [Tissierella creatinophila DSM 6911]
MGIKEPRLFYYVINLIRLLHICGEFIVGVLNILKNSSNSFIFHLKDFK